MQNLLQLSRRIHNQCESPVKLGNISPQKYGKGAYCDLSFTPSKLADNVLYREVATLRKIQEGHGKLREQEALNSLFQDRLRQIKQERDGIQKSLTVQIIMYKKMLQQEEERAEARIKQIQIGFKHEINRLIQEKQQQAKYSQSEKELLESRIQQLEALLADVKDKLDYQVKQHNDLVNQKQKTELMYANSMTNLAQLESKRLIQADDARSKHQQLNKQIIKNQMQSKRLLDQTIANKNRQIESLSRFHKNQLQKIQNKRTAQNLMKTQQLKDLANAFDAESKRLNQIIISKQRSIEALTRQINNEKQVILSITKQYGNEVNTLINQRTRALQVVNELTQANTALQIRFNDTIGVFQQQKIVYEGRIRQLQQNLQLNQVNFIRQNDRNCFANSDLENENAIIRGQNARLRNMGPQIQLLISQNKSLKDLLIESSHEIQKCRNEFLRMGKQRQVLLTQLRELGVANEVLHQIKHQRQQQAKGWKQNYYIAGMNRTRLF